LKKIRLKVLCCIGVKQATKNFEDENYICS
jgi:hypothetical protein